MMIYLVNLGKGSHNLPENRMLFRDIGRQQLTAAGSPKDFKWRSRSGLERAGMKSMGLHPSP